MPDPVRTLAWPFAWTSSGQIASTTVGTVAEIGQCVDVVLSTPLRGLRADPDFGRPDVNFGQGIQGRERELAAVEAAITDHEPRARGYTLIQSPDGTINVDVRGMADDTPVEPTT